MIVVMSRQVPEDNIEAVLDRLKKAGFQIHLSRGVERTIIGAIGDKTRMGDLALEAMPGVESVVPILQPYKLASRAFKEQDTVVKVGDLAIGGQHIHVMAGPCAVESREQLLEAAALVKAAGATLLRGGAFKPRTSPYSFQGLEEKGLQYLAEAREKTGLKIVTEVMDAGTLPMVAEYADILQIGTRNMQNFFLLREVARVDKPVLLKRGASATVEEWLMAAEYIMAGGNYNVILCERGIRTFENFTRNTLDLSAVPVVKHLSHLPVIVDPSHAIGKWRFVPPMAVAAVAAGADGLLIEVHPNPSEALCDGPQSLTPENFQTLMKDVRRVAEAMGRSL
ncbi:3-deoxy-7-phosphoheptulonate synthase [Desulforamulus hydrothermalis]|uniref:Phospho-2-dehydro-3-deoxyheptonate aldolase n=1 Tax=Desulforamulus hydrothermalis Lam5 = DSM 18033 TaxID=1121428 RepID=K8E0D1_9FIRM|nr:3-deoxy-7-phosphoheptulonate synthase [Desulforamulus hydrothermalis]CCO09014.1 Phospho-2-dehydro-3-deoxyheptonate aldolase [Desulforamulus hydrothermalis Lam5 = DSM 18033]SHG76955.1 3-deoxy-D-arabinoheptulosonate-7-phosphate synthase [Desulforamulus hydrothermalis Lam5 = DSM 18033]